MHSLLERFSPEWSLRVGLAFMYLYSGYDLVVHPTAWTWALPMWLREIISLAVPATTYLRVQGAGEIILALIILAWFLPARYVRWAALLSVFEMGGILLVSGNFATTFRDIGLLGASLALFLILSRRDTAERPAGGIIQ